jgi:RimJ/RimL family protein N-acetyltransferase
MAIDSAPPIDTARLTLRGHKAGDIDESAALWADPMVVRHIGGRPFSREESWTRLLRYAGHWALLGFGYWVVRERSSGRFVGEVGLADYRRDLVPAIEGTPEAGWVLAPWAHG